MGLGACEGPYALRFIGRSGREQRHEGVPAGVSVRLTLGGLEMRPLLAPPVRRPPERGVPSALAALIAATPLAGRADPSPAGIVYVAFTASWCSACAVAAPSLAAASRGEVPFLGLSVEPRDDPATGGGAYPHLAPSKEAHARLLAAIEAELGGPPPLPSGVLLDLSTRTRLATVIGIPTRSDLHVPPSPRRWPYLALVIVIGVGFALWRR